MNALLSYLETSYTPYHAVANAQKLLLEGGFVRLYENEAWNLAEGGKYFVVRGGSALVAFTVGKKHNFKIIASHTDSPCLKLKANPVLTNDGYSKLNAETYGGGIWYTFFDRPLKVAGRIVTKKKNGTLESKLYTADYTLTLPSLAIHMQREVNAGFAPNAQTDLSPLFSLGESNLELPDNTLSYDLFLACAQKPYESGKNGELVCTPRADNLTSVYSSLCALLAAKPVGINVCACFDNEEVGSHTAQGAASDFLSTTLERICSELHEDNARTLASSFLLSLDNAHAVHPNHPEKSDPTNRPLLGGGVVIKSHADRAYTTDALTCAVVQTIFDKANVKYQHFYNRSDMRSGSTLGALSLTQAGIPSCDIGLAQLAMHSAVETFAKDDYLQLEKGLKAFFESDVILKGETVTVK